MFHVVWDKKLEDCFSRWCIPLPHYLERIARACLGEFVTRFSNDPFAELIQEDHQYPGLYTWEFGEVLPLKFTFKLLKNEKNEKIVELYKIEGSYDGWDLC